MKRPDIEAIGKCLEDAGWRDDEAMVKLADEYVPLLFAYIRELEAALKEILEEHPCRSCGACWVAENVLKGLRK